MEQKNVSTEKILGEKNSVTINATQCTFNEEKEETEDQNSSKLDNLEKEKLSNYFEHENLLHLSTSSTKATNWSLKMHAEYNILNIMKDYLMEHTSIIAIRGCIENTNSQPQNMTIMLKFIRPTIKSTICKIIKECSLLPQNESVSVFAVTKAEHVKILLENIHQKNEDREFFEKGDFKYSRQGKDGKIDPLSKIAELGLCRAKLWWADKNLPHKEFKKAEAQYSWVQNVKRSIQYDKQPEEDINIDPMNKIQELGLSSARLWWAEHNLPCQEFKKAETQYLWVENVKKHGEIKEEKIKTDPFSKIIELGLSEAKLWWADKHLPYNEFEKAENQYHWEQEVKYQYLAESTKESEKDTILDPMIKIEELGLSRAGEWWAEQRLPFEEFYKAEAQYNWEQEKKLRGKLREQSEVYMRTLRPWQKYVYDIFKQKPDARKIYVVLDKDGGNGKTTLQNILTDLHPDEVIDMKNGKTRDMSYLAKNFGKCKMIQLNLTRQTIGTVNLSALESMKDGNFASMKYIPKKIRMNPPHVFVYTNTELSWEDLSEDRYEIIHLDRAYEEGFRTFTLFQWNDTKTNKI